RYILVKVDNFIVAVVNNVNYTKNRNIEEELKRVSVRDPKNFLTFKNFPHTNGTPFASGDVFYFQFDGFMKTEGVIAEMKKVGKKPANIWALPGVAEKESLIHRTGEGLVFLATTGFFKDKPHTVCLSTPFGQPLTTPLEIKPEPYEGVWGNDYIFAAVNAQ
ncbi:MAG: hypothetical protein WCO30_02100, partial [bacterium]